MIFLTATQSTWFLIGWIAKGLGYIMNAIYDFMYWFSTTVFHSTDMPSIGIAIILCTIVIKALMIPLTIKQQKFSKLQSVMSPEIQAIQNKYKGKKDNASLMAQQEETKTVYEKYGTSATGGCLQMLIQMPILFALYQVIYKLPGYIGRIKALYDGPATVLERISGWNTNEALISLATSNQVQKAAEVFAGDNAHNYIIDMMYNFSQKEWQSFLDIFNNGQLTSAYESAKTAINQANGFLGFDLADTPFSQMFNGPWWIVFIPILSGVLQWLSTRVMSSTQPTGTDDQNSMAASMKTMNYMFPLMSVVFCFMFSAGLGIYWVASSGVQVLVQLFVNNYINKVDINEMVEQNIAKANEKRARKGLPPKKYTSYATSIQSIEQAKANEEALKTTLKEQADVSTAYYEAHTTAKKGSLAEKAGMVQAYEDRMKEQKSGKRN